jgi:hypothetical protein
METTLTRKFTGLIGTASTAVGRRMRDCYTTKAHVWGTTATSKSSIGLTHVSPLGRVAGRADVTAVIGSVASAHRIRSKYHRGSTWVGFTLRCTCQRRESAGAWRTWRDRVMIVVKCVDRTERTVCGGLVARLICAWWAQAAARCGVLIEVSHPSLA